jgi:hypothetical protein
MQVARSGFRPKTLSDLHRAKRGAMSCIQAQLAFPAVREFIAIFVPWFWQEESRGRGTC